MGYLDKLTEEEAALYQKAAEIGLKYGDCSALRQLYRQVMADYQAGRISPRAYGLIYGICMECAYPRPKTDPSL